MSDQPETGERLWSADERDRGARQRDDAAGERDGVAAARDLVADQRDRLADARESGLDEREQRLTGLGPASERDGAALARGHAGQERQLEEADRDAAAVARDQADQRRLAATPAPGPGRPPGSSGDREEQAWAADKRDFVADERDRVADGRDAIADARDVLADEREQLADAREAELDERERRLAARGGLPGPAADAMAADAGPDHARLLRDQARQHREQRQAARDGATAARDRSRRQRQAATPATGLALAFAEIARHLNEAGSAADVLTRIAETCIEAVPGCQLASITVRGADGNFRTVASTDAAAVAADQAQYEAGEGPCLTALGEAVVYTPEFPDPRWPALDSRPAGAGVYSVVSYGLAAPGSCTSGPLTGSLNAYATSARAYDEEAREIGLILAAHASVALQAVGEREALEQLGRQLHAALSSRDVIGQAKGILMERLRITPDDAFDVLRRSSQQLNLKLREIAQKLTETGQLDGSGRDGG